MAEESNDDDRWLDQLRAALAEASESNEPAESATDLTSDLSTELTFDGDRPTDIGWSTVEPEPVVAPEPHPEPFAPEPAAPVASEPVPVVEPTPALRAADTSLILETLTEVTRAVTRLADRVDAFENVEPVAGPFDQLELDAVVADAIRQSMAKAQATGAGTTRLETEVRVLEETVSKLSKRVGELNIAALARDRLEKDVHVERLADAAEAVERQLSTAAEARKAFEAGVDKMLRHAQEGDGENVAWTDVMLLTHELRSRVDDLDDQQRRAMRDLADWQTTVDDRLSALRAELVNEVRRLRAPE